MKSTANLPIRIITHNIRYATTQPFKGEKPWAERLPLLLSELKFATLYNPEAFICLQEVLHSQLLDILRGLNSTSTTNSYSTSSHDEWTYIGIGRDDGLTAGEYSPILYRPSIWKLQHWKTVWLSEHPDRPGKGWDAASVRIVTVGRFKHRESKEKVVGMSTHFDDQGEISRRESAKLVLETIEKETKGEYTDSVRQMIPVLLAGDLNSQPHEEAYQILNSPHSLVQDVKELSPMVYGDTNTFTGFVSEEKKTEIDHLFVNRQGGRWDVRSFAVLPNRFEGGVFVSDHRAVVGDVCLRAVA